MEAGFIKEKDEEEEVAMQMCKIKVVCWGDALGWMSEWI